MKISTFDQYLAIPQMVAVTSSDLRGHYLKRIACTTYELSNKFSSVVTEVKVEVTRL